MKEKGNSLDRFLGEMKIPAKGRRDGAQADAALPSMEVDTALRSRAKVFSSSRKRFNEDENATSDELLVLTALNREKMPARLRLSVRRRTWNAGATPDGTATEKQESEDHENRSAREEFPLTDRKRALFEPLGPALRGPRDGVEDDSLLPPPDFEFASYPRGWVVGKKRKLVNVDVVESMRRVAVHEMNRKDREITGLNEQLEEDSRTMEHIQFQLQQERTKRMQAERENTQLQGQINMLMNMLNEGEEDEVEEMDRQ